MEIRTREHYYDGAHHERPRFHAPIVRLSVRTEDGESQSWVSCDDLAYSRDSLRFECKGLPFGDLVLEAEYSDKRGAFWNIIDFDIAALVVARGRVTIRRDGHPVRIVESDLRYHVGH
jgi:hypothetical protein